MEVGEQDNPHDDLSDDYQRDGGDAADQLSAPVAVTSGHAASL
jgi:hypothetical protein